MSLGPEFLRNIANPGIPDLEHLREVGYIEQLTLLARNIDEGYVLEKLTKSFGEPICEFSLFVESFQPHYDIFTQRYQYHEDPTDAYLHKFYKLYFSSLAHTHKIIKSGSSLGILHVSDEEKPSSIFSYSHKLAAALIVAQKQYPHILTNKLLRGGQILKIPALEKQSDTLFISLIYYIFNDRNLIGESVDANWPTMKEIVDKQLFI